nr:transporter [Phaeosphaeriaceae sp. CF-150626]
MSLQNSSDTIPSTSNISLSNSSTNRLFEPHDPEPSPYTSQPDGGPTAWLQVLGSFILFFNTWGAMNTFGVFQTYYESGALFTQSSSNIAWIGSIQTFCLQAMGLVAGPVYDRGGFRVLVVIGSAGVVGGYVVLSFCKEFWHVVLAQGFLIGLAEGCLFTPMISILPTYFSKRVGLAMGIASSGSSLGGVISPIVMKSLMYKIGFAWTTRVLGFMAFSMLLVPVLVMKERVKPAVRKRRAIVDRSVFTDRPFIMFVVATMVGFVALTIALFYLSLFALAQKITDEDLAFYVVPLYNAASIFGRIAPNFLSDKVGPLNVIAPCAIITGVLLFCLVPLRAGQVGGIVVLTILLGFFSGVFVAIPGTCFPRLTKDKSMLGTRVGMAFSVIGFGMLIGGPAAGRVLDPSTSTKGPLNFMGLWVFGGVAAIVSGCFGAYQNERTVQMSVYQVYSLYQELQAIYKCGAKHASPNMDYCHNTAEVETPESCHTQTLYIAHSQIDWQHRTLMNRSPNHKSS